ncbi:hypothetical protein SARC_05045 [Sphaeroforma arctica JP610]|uniref:Uncharacterized protein n=1 Tax=Sphaeroforma arctica JP610 TaxID=667725 RepID=A0A0L0G3B0_9EUKA|nr:hypothetical protein SARC_05045 [Sphaeroforma arctica JP610]KNC82668.1 hypothetical protein SARC_05045 [Sphaeroforma arctica JP610]|eukprot:XP_014156570.1 hypothetical protein SARC_05045 [Sphaeroforma arctica JP610]
MDKFILRLNTKFVDAFNMNTVLNDTEKITFLTGALHTNYISIKLSQVDCHNSDKTSIREAEGDLQAEEVTTVEEDFLDEAISKIQDKAAVLIVTARRLSHTGHPTKTNAENSTDDLEIEDEEDTKIMD